MGTSLPNTNGDAVEEGARLPEHPPNRAEMHLQAALLCERLLVDQEGAASLIRVVDQFFFDVPDNRDDYRLHLVVNAVLYVAIRGGHPGQEATFRVELARPGRDRERTAEISAAASEGFGGFNVHIDLRIGAGTEGVYGLELYLDDRFLVRVPFRVEHRRTLAPTPPDDESSSPPANPTG